MSPTSHWGNHTFKKFNKTRATMLAASLNQPFVVHCAFALRIVTSTERRMVSRGTASVGLSCARSVLVQSFQRRSLNVMRDGTATKHGECAAR